MSWANEQFPLSLSRYVGSCAANAEQEIALGRFPNNGARLLRVAFYPDGDIETDTTSGFAFHLLNKGTAGTVNTTIATYTATTAAATLSKYKELALTFSTASGAQSVTEDQYLTWKETTIGTGTARANGVVRVEYTLV
jgi:hypothetical protein